MKFSTKKIGQPVNILANDHFVAIPYNCEELTSLAKDGVIMAGTIIPSNDSNALGVLLNDVVLDENPNGAVVVHGYVKIDKLPEAPTTEAASALVTRSVFLVDSNSMPLPQKYTVTYDVNGGEGTVTDSSSPYNYGAEVTVQAGTSITPPDSKTFKGWALSATATVKDDNYDPSDKFKITSNVTLYAVYGE